MQRRLLVVASDVSLRRALARWLASAGYAVELAEGPKKAREVLAAVEVVAGILRIEPLNVAFLALAKELREIGGGVIALADDVSDIGGLKRFGLSADAYLVQPLKRNDVVERVEAVTRSLDTGDKASESVVTINFSGMTLDIPGHSLIDSAGRRVKLTRGEFAILAALARRCGWVLSRDQLLDAVSGRNADAFDRSIDNLIARLRRKIESDVKKPRIILTVRGAGYKLSSLEQAAPQLPLTVAHRCSILVLPFANLSGGPELSHCGAAVTTALMSELRHIVGTRVVCHPEIDGDAFEIGRRFGARYIVRGSVRRIVGDVRVDAQMTDAKTGVPIWADRFDGKLVDLFAFEREVTARIARAIDMEVVNVESRCGLDLTSGVRLQALVTRGYACLYRLRSAGNLATARSFFEGALRIDDRHPEALAGLAHTHISDTLCRWSADPDAQVRLADESVTRAIETDSRLAYAYHVRGLIFRVRQEHERALAAFDMAVQLNPSLAPAHAELGFTKQILDGVENGFDVSLDALALARRISPTESVLANWLYGLVSLI